MLTIGPKIQNSAAFSKQPDIPVKSPANDPQPFESDDDVDIWRDISSTSATTEKYVYCEQRRKIENANSQRKHERSGVSDRSSPVPGQKEKQQPHESIVVLKSGTAYGYHVLADPPSSTEDKPPVKRPGRENASGKSIPELVLVKEPEAGISGSHEHDHNLLGFDVDEAVHAFEKFFRQVAAMATGKSGEMFKGESQLVTLKPTHWLSGQVVQTSGAEIGSSFAVTIGFAIPFSVIAFFAGISEFKEARQISIALNTRKKALEATIMEPATPMLKNARFGGLASRIIQQQALADIKSALVRNRYNGSIGISSTASGASIFLKALLDLGMQSAAMANASLGVGSTVAALVGAVSTIFAVVPAFFAVALGGFFVARSSRNLSAIKQDLKLIAGRSHEKNSTGKSSAVPLADQAYRVFIQGKLNARLKFWKKFLGWNCGFLAGASFFTASTTLKVVLGVSVFAGFVGMLGSPVGIAIITVLGIVGGIMMIVSSYSFFKWHGKSKQYEASQIQESPHLSRQFDALQTISAGSTGPDSADAISLRSALYDFMSKRDATRQEFLYKLASDQNKFFRWKQPKLENQQSGTRPDTKVRQRYKDVAASFFYVGAYLANIFRGAGHRAAVQAAREVYTKKADKLTMRDIASCLRLRTGPCDNKAQTELIVKFLTQENMYLKTKIVAYQNYSKFFEVDELECIQAEYRLDELRFSQNQVLLNCLGYSRSSDQISAIKTAFLRSHGVQTDVDNFDVDEAMAEYLLNGLDREFKTNRSILVDMHRTSFQMFDKYQRSEAQQSAV